ncbi:Uncharacterised protein [Vibrio cholerae]|nr:Uncharacterised protein [Vibrio cholerae]
MVRSLNTTINMATARNSSKPSKNSKKERRPAASDCHAYLSAFSRTASASLMRRLRNSRSLFAARN